MHVTNILLFSSLLLRLLSAYPADPHEAYRGLLAMQNAASLSFPRASLRDFMLTLPLASPCIARLGHIANHFLTDPAVSLFLQYSGKQINDVGGYDECDQTESSYFLVMAIMFSPSTGYRFGFCVPKECSVPDLQAAKPDIAAFLSSALGMYLSPSMIILGDMREIPETFHKLKPSAVIMICFTGLFALLIIVASVLDYNWTLAQHNDSMLAKALVCFSAQRNIKSLFNTENRVDGKLEVLNGIRVWSICWVVIGHTFSIMMAEGILNIQEVLVEVKESFFIGIIKAGVLAVDVFFFLSGFLAALAFYRVFKNPRNVTVKTVVFAYIHRYVRLLPLLLVSSFIFTQLLPLMFDTPNVHVMDTSIESCENRSYLNLLYVSNFFESIDRTCVGWAWYLMNDMQMYVFLPFLVIAYVKSRRLGLFILLAVTVVSAIIQFALCYYYDFNLSFGNPNSAKSSLYVYIKPYCRVIPYLQGVFMYFLYEDGKEETGTVSVFKQIQRTVKESQLVRIVLYLVGGVCIFLPVYSFYFLDRYPESWGKAFGLVQILTCKPVFVLGLSLIILPVLVGEGKPLLGFLGHPTMNVLGKLTYGTYMLHIPVVVWSILGSVQARVYTQFDTIIRTSGYVLLSYIVAFVVDILYESPVAQLLKLLLGQQRAGGKDKGKGEEKTKATAETEGSANTASN